MSTPITITTNETHTYGDIQNIPSDSNNPGGSTNVSGSGGTITLTDGGQPIPILYNTAFKITKDAAGNVAAKGTEGADSYDYLDQTQPANATLVNRIYGLGGDDKFRLNSYTKEVVYGGEGNDSFDARTLGNGAPLDTIYGGNGDDYFLGGNGTLSGEAGNDEFSWVGSGGRAFGGEGNDDLTTAPNASGVALFGDNGDDTITGITAALSVLDGGAGNDEIVTVHSAGGNKIYGRAGDDTIRATTPFSSASVTGAIKADSIYGGDGNDNITVNQYVSNNLTHKFSGLISGDAGNDRIEVTQADHATVSGGDGNDFIFESGISTNSTILGGAGNDSVYLNISYGTEIILTGVKTDSINAGDGDDSVAVNCSGGIKFSGTVAGGAGNDTIFVVQADQANINGGDGNDSIRVEVFNVPYTSSSIGGMVPDVLRTDAIYGGAGNDTIYAKNNDIVNAGVGDDYVKAGPSAGGGYYAPGGANIQLGDGNDTGLGSGNSDTLAGSLGNDSLFGDMGNDTLRGDQGNDTVQGGVGNDLLYGGLNADVFVFSASSAGNDTIYDFNVNEDKISFVRSYYGSIAAPDVQLTNTTVGGAKGVLVEYTSHFGGSASLPGSTHLDTIFVRGATVATISDDLLFI